MIKTVGDLRKIIYDLDDDFKLDIRIVKKMTEEEYKLCISQLHYCLSYHESDKSLFDNLEQLEQLVEKHFELLEELEILKEQNSILNAKVIENNLKEMNYLMEKQDD